MTIGVSAGRSSALEAGRLLEEELPRGADDVNELPDDVPDAA